MEELLSAAGEDASDSRSGSSDERFIREERVRPASDNERLS